MFPFLLHGILSSLASFYLGATLSYESLSIQGLSISFHTVFVQQKGAITLVAPSLRLFWQQGRWGIELEEPDITVRGPLLGNTQIQHSVWAAQRGTLRWRMPHKPQLVTPFSLSYEGPKQTVSLWHNTSSLHIQQTQGVLSAQVSLQKISLKDASTFVQGCGVPIGHLLQKALFSGELSLQGKGTYDLMSQHASWEISQGELSSFYWEDGSQNISCNTLKGFLNSEGDGELAFHDAAFGALNPLPCHGTTWQGHIALQKHHFLFSSCHGLLQGLPVNLQFHGPLVSAIATGRIGEEGSVLIHWDQLQGTFQISGASLHAPFLGTPFIIGSLYCTGKQEESLWQCQLNVEDISWKPAEELRLEGASAHLIFDTLGTLHTSTVKGSLIVFGTQSQLAASIFEQQGSPLYFDLSVQQPLCERIHLAGSFQHSLWHLDLQKSHAFGAPLFFQADPGTIEIRGEVPLFEKRCAMRTIDSLCFTTRLTYHEHSFNIERFQLQGGPYSLACTLQQGRDIQGSVHTDMGLLTTFVGLLDLPHLQLTLQLPELRGFLPEGLPLRGRITGHGSCSLSPQAIHASLVFESETPPLTLSLPQLTYSFAQKDREPLVESPNTEMILPQEWWDGPPLRGDLYWTPSTSCWSYHAPALTSFLHHVHVHCEDGIATASFLYPKEDRPLQIEMRSILEAPYFSTVEVLDDTEQFTIHFSYPDASLEISSIHGSLCGLQALFVPHSPSTLIGSVEIQFQRLQPILPPPLAHMVETLELGNGYTLRGILSHHPLSFHGTLDGKKIDFFGYQFQTLQSHIEIASQHLRISHLKISDRACDLILPELTLFPASTEPCSWHIEIPSIILSELRPSLLTIPHVAEEPLTPLVIRTCTLNHFHGTLGDTLSYSAEGQLDFINSFKRDRSLFDLPSALLGRVFGFDLELLIPVQGTLRYQLKEGFFHLTDLVDTYSEGHRSYFSLLTSGPYSPTMDLDGNLRILLETKQYVLFTLTEHFYIAIDGTLKKPKFHLRKK